MRTRYRLVIQPWLAFLGHNQESRVFLEQTVMEIVNAIFNTSTSQFSVGVNTTCTGYCEK